jgi:hypothetical protein
MQHAVFAVSCSGMGSNDLKVNVDMSEKLRRRENAILHSSG